MGGIGSGTHLRLDTRDMVDDMRALDISKLATADWLRSGRTCTYSWSRGGRSTGNIRVLAVGSQIAQTSEHEKLAAEVLISAKAV